MIIIVSVIAEEERARPVEQDVHDDQNSNSEDRAEEEERQEHNMNNHENSKPKAI